MVVPSPTSPHPSLDKSALRSAVRRARKLFVASLSQAQRDVLETQLCSQVKPLIEAASITAAYHPIGSEIDPGRLLQLATGLGKRIALPAFDQADSIMRFREGSAAQIGPHGIPQPGKVAADLRPDLVFVPLLAVDPNGHRLGQGGGHYDRALPALKAGGTIIIGVGWALQRLDFALPAEPWDVPLDGFASPNGLEMFR